MFGFFEKNTNTQDDSKTVEVQLPSKTAAPHVTANDTALKESIADKLKNYNPSDRAADFSGTRV